MKSIEKNLIAILIGLVGLIGGIIWAIKSNWEMEPVILSTVSFIEIIGFILINPAKEELVNDADLKPIKTNEQNVSVNVNIGNNRSGESNFQKNDTNIKINREMIIDSMKSKTRILFIDDDDKFNVVRILKDSGWKNTKTVIDLKSLDMPIVKDADIYFVDINGVGKHLNLPNEGLDLALILKQKYPTKKVVIYSANKNSNSFHQAWDKCDFKLEKNALPYQFQSLVEEYSVELYNIKK